MLGGSAHHSTVDYSASRCLPTVMVMVLVLVCLCLCMYIPNERRT